MWCWVISPFYHFCCFRCVSQYMMPLTLGWTAVFFTLISIRPTTLHIHALLHNNHTLKSQETTRSQASQKLMLISVYWVYHDKRTSVLFDTFILSLGVLTSADAVINVGIIFCDNTCSTLNRPNASSANAACATQSTHAS